MKLGTAGCSRECKRPQEEDKYPPVFTLQSLIGYLPPPPAFLEGVEMNTEWEDVAVPNVITLSRTLETLSPQAAEAGAVSLSNVLGCGNTPASGNFHQGQFPRITTRIPVGSWIKPELINFKFKPRLLPSLSVQPQLPLFQPGILFIDSGQATRWVSICAF